MAETLRVLVVDDDPYLLDLLTETLKAIGYEACGAADARQALAMLETTEAHLVITDIKMPDMDGVELARHIRQRHPGLPIIFISGVFTPSILQMIDNEPILTKPFRIGQMEAMIKKTVQQSAVVTPGPAKTVLVVDDDDSFRVMLAETMKLSGYAVRLAADGEDALKLLAEEEFSAVITDIKMPGMDGITLARQIRKNYPGLPVVLITAYLAGVDHKEGAAVADGFLMKPFRIESITTLLENIKDGRSPSGRTES